MDIGKLFHSVTSMIVAYFDTTGRPVVPDKTETPLVVNSNTPLPVAVAGEFFQPILGGNTEIVNPTSVVQHTQFAPGHSLNLGRKTAGKFSFPNFLGFVVLERSDHTEYANAQRKQYQEQ
jgi:hypothetical protein